MEKRNISVKIIGKTLITYVIVLAIVKWMKERLVDYPLPLYFQNALAYFSYTELLLYSLLFIQLLFLYQVLEIAEP